jgi:hypothetical protein
MKIEIKHNEAPNLKKCVMTCDTGISEKLNNYELTKFLNQHSTNLLIGRPRSGKTSLLYSLFRSNKILRNCFHTIYIFQPKQSRASMSDKIFDSLPEDQLYDELTFENLNDVLERIKLDADEGFNSCIIFDDMTAYLKNKETLKLFKELIFNRRHLRTSLYFCVQTWFSVPKDLRRLWSNIFIFKTTKEELNNIWNEVIELPIDLIDEIRKLVYNEPFKYLFINVDTQRLFDGFDEIIINE